MDSGSNYHLLAGIKALCVDLEVVATDLGKTGNIQGMSGKITLLAPARRIAADRQWLAAPDEGDIPSTGKLAG